MRQTGLCHVRRAILCHNTPIDIRVFLIIMIDRSLQDLQAWVDYFTAADIPVLRHTMQELDRCRASADRVSARLLAGIILHDPLMTLRVMVYLAKHRRQRQTTDITTIDRAIMMIGVEPFFRDFQHLPLVEEQLKTHPQAMLGLIKVANRSWRAAQWARDWAIVRHDLDVDEITVAALLHDLDEMLMWSFAPSLAIQVRDMQNKDRELRSAAAQTAVYGVALSDLQLELAKAWQLPDLLIMLMDPHHADHPRVRNVLLAVDVARHSAKGWDNPALPDDFSATCSLLRISHEQLIRRLGVDEETAEMLLQRQEPSSEEGESNEDSVAEDASKDAP